jgi:hypothetical protein
MKLGMGRESLSGPRKHGQRFFRVGLGSVGLLRLVVFCWSGLTTKRGRYAGEMGGGERVLGGP